jgi:hypothetical protein
MIRRTFGLMAMGALLLGGCALGEEPSPRGTTPVAQAGDPQALVEGTPEALGVLALLADPATTLYVLDELVPLDKRAAENLIAHRNGPDGVLGTADDDAFDTLAEVDAIPYVGATALAKLTAYAEAKGYVPSGEDLLGVYDNVAFTVNEANATLAFVNTASHETLDVQVGLDVRAVDAIEAARPIQSMPALSGVYYVGHSAMLKLREFPKTQGPAEPLPPPPPSTGTAEDWAPCNAHDECASGLCAGLYAPYYDHGYCHPAWMAGTFQSTTPVGIGDDGVPVKSSINVSGLATVPVDVVVDLDISHPQKQDLVVVLHQPGGADAVLWNHQQNPPSHFETPKGIEGDNMVNGEWVLEVTDTVTGQSGSIKSWKMWLSSRYD